MPEFEFVKGFKLVIDPQKNGFKAVLLDSARKPTPAGKLSTNFWVSWDDSPFKVKKLMELTGAPREEILKAMRKIGSEIELKGPSSLGLTESLSEDIESVMKLPDWEADGRIANLLAVDKNVGGDKRTFLFKVFIEEDGKIAGVPLDENRFLTNTAPSAKLFELEEMPLLDIYQKLKNRMTAHLYFTNDVQYDIQVLGPMASYFREIFSTFPYFDYLSAENGCGKTTAMKCAIWSSFYGFLMLIPTAPVLFRSIDDTHGAVGIDQVDDMFKNPKQNSDVLILLDAGHMKGVYAYRMDMDAKPPKIVPYDPFSFKAFTRVRWIPPSLLSRAITFRMVQNKGFKAVEPDPKPEEFKLYRDAMYTYRIKHWKDVEVKYNDLKNERILEGRQADLYLPLLTMAKLVSQDVYDRVLGYAKEDEARRSVIKRDERVIALVELLVKTERVGTVRVTDIRSALEAKLRADGLHTGDKGLSSQKVIGLLDALGFDKSPVRSQGFIHYEIAEDRLIQQGQIYLFQTPLQTSLTSLTSLKEALEKLEKEREEKPPIARKGTKKAEKTGGLEGQKTLGEVGELGEVYMGVGDPTTTKTETPQLPPPEHWDMSDNRGSQHRNIRRVMDIIGELEGQHGGLAPIEEIMRIAESEGIKRSFVDELLNQEKQRGHLYEPKEGMITRAVKG